MPSKSSFLDKVLGRIGRLDTEGLQTVVQRLARERNFLEMLFNAIANRYEHKSVLVTSNLSFSEWPKVFAGDEKLTAALLDRLADHAAIITTHGKSYRMRRREVETSKKGGALAQGQVEIVAPTGSQGPPRKEDSSPETNPPPADPSARRQQHLRKR